MNNTRFADDTMIIATSAEDIQRIIKRANRFCDQYGLKMSMERVRYVYSNNQKVAYNRTLTY